MKSKFIKLSAAIILGAGLISMQETSSNTGSIKITCIHDDKPVAEALVGVSTSEENLENSKYVFEGETNASGVIYYKDVAPGTYYVDASIEDLYGEAKVTVADGEVAVTVKMTEDLGEDDEEGEDD